MKRARQRQHMTYAKSRRVSLYFISFILLNDMPGIFYEHTIFNIIVALERICMFWVEIFASSNSHLHTGANIWKCTINNKFEKCFCFFNIVYLSVGRYVRLSGGWEILTLAVVSANSNFACTYVCIRAFILLACCRAFMCMLTYFSSSVRFLFRKSLQNSIKPFTNFHTPNRNFYSLACYLNLIFVFVLFICQTRCLQFLLAFKKKKQKKRINNWTLYT